VISMTATPIPRSLALTLYGELDISVIISRPNNRQHISTSIVSPNSLNTLFATVDKLIEQGRQVFVVCPLIKSSDTMQGVSSADEIFKDLSTKYFKHRTLSLLHGKMKANEKDKIMSDFIKNKTQILVSTTVIEVGVDVPNASVMLIYSAERFGLAQLHQLRGRIGRGEHQGYCYAILSDSKPPSKRLRAFSQTNDGFKLSELDLELRGPGAIYGTLQHGQLDLRMAKLTDTKLIAAAQLSAKHFIKQNESLIQYKHLARTIHKSQFITTLN
ncbi:DNA helicase RecG, partial [Candidatus Saccharibacteria bacterium]|nr:DNA helicase RecG [Candidatus Saccharibacteria bacterium]